MHMGSFEMRHKDIPVPRPRPRDGRHIEYRESPIWNSRAANDVLHERRRQVEAEGWTPERDDAHGRGEIARAACSYAYEAGRTGQQRSDSLGSAPPMWPWDLDWWKPSNARRDLVKAGALILAEIERLDRVARNTERAAATPASAVGVPAERERIARIIKPHAQEPWQRRFEYQRATVGQDEAHAARTASYYHPEWYEALAKADAILATRPTDPGGARGWEPFSFTGPELRKVETALLDLGRAAIRSQKITQHEDANAALRTCWQAIEAIVAERGAPSGLRDALGEPFVTTVSGGGQKPYLRLAYPTTDAVHVAHDALAGFLRPPAASTASSDAGGAG